MQLSSLPMQWLIEEEVSLMQRIAKVNQMERVATGNGQQFDTAYARHLGDRLIEVNAELAYRAQVSDQHKVREYASTLPQHVAEYLVANHRPA